MCQPSEVYASACSVARAFSLYCRKTGPQAEAKQAKGEVRLEVILVQEGMAMPATLTQNEVKVKY